MTTRLIRHRSGLALGLLSGMLSTMTGYAQDAGRNLPAGPAAPGVDAPANSASDGFTADRIDLFRPGRAKREILEELRWAGNFEMAGRHDGRSVAAISFVVRPRPDSLQGETLWALFEDDRFAKFVFMRPGEAEHPADIALPIPVGTSRALDVALRRPGIPTAEIKEYVEGLGAAAPVPADPVLTAIAQRVGEKQKDQFARIERQNRELRDQFNAARLRLGMTRDEVVATLHARPLEAGPIATGTYELYGSLLANPAASMRYANILLAYEGDRLATIYSGRFVPGGADGLARLRESPQAGVPAHFTGLPPVPGPAPVRPEAGGATPTDPIPNRPPTPEEASAP